MFFPSRAHLVLHFQPPRLCWSWRLIDLCPSSVSPLPTFRSMAPTSPAAKTSLQASTSGTPGCTRPPRCTRTRTLAQMRCPSALRLATVPRSSMRWRTLWSCRWAGTRSTRTRNVAWYVCLCAFPQIVDACAWTYARKLRARIDRSAR